MTSSFLIIFPVVFTIFIATSAFTFYKLRHYFQ